MKGKFCWKKDVTISSWNRAGWFNTFFFKSSHFNLLVLPCTLKKLNYIFNLGNDGFQQGNSIFWIRVKFHSLLHPFADFWYLPCYFPFSKNIKCFFLLNIRAYTYKMHINKKVTSILIVLNITFNGGWSNKKKVKLYA